MGPAGEDDRSQAVSDPARAAVRKRSVRLAGHATSISLEAAFWDQLRAIARLEGLSLNALVARIDAARTGGLSGAARIFVLDWILVNGPPDSVDESHAARESKTIDSI